MVRYSEFKKWYGFVIIIHTLLGRSRRTENSLGLNKQIQKRNKYIAENIKIIKKGLLRICMVRYSEFEKWYGFVIIIHTLLGRSRRTENSLGLIKQIQKRN